MTTVHDTAGGHDGLLRLAHAWHTRALADEVVAHAFSHGHHPDHTTRLAAYRSEALGGPPLFSTAVGDETTVVRLHSGNGPHKDMDRRAIDAFAPRSPTSPCPPRSRGFSSTTSLGPPRSR
ncbi:MULTISPECIES: globin domain-containing protein [Catenuloplanes]|uniref:Truncated hemoglobin YjbI n=1 Tax=Catenuloplanes niger TaxID=587534 RepID=A0AAE3ZY83_9ACTN|nr:hypothetical protein [Catenuloplanes niger]MDR7328111.1 truncated hemoglobin YjbI [Catenuloplanes niger]